jgi:SAM-dependent methyltransferase
MSLTHTTLVPSEWVQRWTHLAQPASTVLDVACGHGRHMRWFSERGHSVTGIDRSSEAGADAAVWGEFCLADIESTPWPLLPSATGSAVAVRQFDLVVVCNYLWRPLVPTILQCVKPGGLLIYETFAAGNETVGKPSRPDFLLRRGELLDWCQGMRIHAFEDVYRDNPMRFVQRIVATAPR